LVLEAIRAGLVNSAHDVSEGGLAACLAESCLASGLGAAIDAVPGEGLAAALFGETPPRIVLSAAPGAAERVMAMAADADVECAPIGEVAEGGLGLLGGEPIALAELRRAHTERPI
jgi:phosphoribosylformylglycinamidine synthase